MRRFNTGNAQQTFIKALCYGPSGAGKTVLSSTAPEPERSFIVSAEGGTLSLSGVSLEGAHVDSMSATLEVYEWLIGSDEAKQFNFIHIDSISEIAEYCLAEEMPKHKDGRQAYGAVQTRIKKLIRAFRDLPAHHVYMTAKQARVQDDQSRMYCAPDLPGSKLAASMPYWFDLVLAYRLNKTTDPETGEVKTTRALQCHGDENYIAKDRSGKLDLFEPPHLGQIMNKIGVN